MRKLTNLSLPRKIFLLLCLLLVMPISWVWTQEVLFLQDLPTHVANAFLFKELSRFPFLQQFFELQFNLYPYLLQDILLILFLPFGVDFSQKIFCSIVLASIPLGTFYWIYRMDSSKVYWALFTLPLSFNKLFFKGNLSFLLGVGIALFFLGYAWRVLYPSNPKESNQKYPYAILAVLFLLVYLSHLLAFGVATLYASSMLFWYGISTSKTKALKIAGLLLPSIAIALYISLSVSITSDSNVYSLTESINNKIGEIRGLLLNFSIEEWIRIKMYLFVTCILATLSLIHIKRIPQLFFPTLLLCLAYLIAPRDLGQLVRLHERILFFLLFVFPVLISSIQWPARYYLNRFAILFVAVFSGYLCYQQNQYYHKISTQIQPIMQASLKTLSQIPENKILAYIWGRTPYIGTIGIGTHLDSYYIIEKKGFSHAIFANRHLLAQYKKDKIPEYIQDPKKITEKTLSMYNAVFVWGNNLDIHNKLTSHGFNHISQSSIFGAYVR